MARAGRWWLPPLIALALAALLPWPVARPQMHQRYAGALKTSGDVLWVKVAGRVPFMQRVPPEEAEMNYNLLRLAGRLNPENTEPWRFGSLGLAFWGRPDLGLDLITEGMRRHPSDTSFDLALVTLSAANAKNGAAVAECIDRYTADLDTRQLPLMYQLKGILLENCGDLAGSMAAWEQVQATVRDDAWLTERAGMQVRRLRRMIERYGDTMPVADPRSG